MNSRAMQPFTGRRTFCYAIPYGATQQLRLEDYIKNRQRLGADRGRTERVTDCSNREWKAGFTESEEASKRMGYFPFPP